jgi:hypothetical protein
MGEKAFFYVSQLRTEDRPVLVLDNLIKMGRSTSDARKEVAKVAKAMDYDRAAMVGDGSMPMRLGTNLMLRAIGRGNLRYFNSLESARKWLLEGAKVRTKSPRA